MKFELPGIRNRREILAAPELLKVEPVGMKLSIFTRSLMVALLTVLYLMFVAGVTGNIINNNMHDKTTFIKLSIIAAIMLTSLYLCAVALIIRNKRNPLIFTETGIVGTGFFNAKYERIGTFRWEICNGLLATGEATKQSKKTLLITANTGFFPEMAYKTRIGTSILGSYGYYFDETQINKVEVILSGVGIKKLPDKT